ncbi:hypothetical protein CDD83_11001 [Cordyceps sp. RAO-2017]|nr:hypothetical protein CDD83_11001 [Cordyceps sp. RAO-2017]
MCRAESWRGNKAQDDQDDQDDQDRDVDNEIGTYTERQGERKGGKRERETARGGETEENRMYVSVPSTVHGPHRHLLLCRRHTYAARGVSLTSTAACAPSQSGRSHPAVNERRLLCPAARDEVQVLSLPAAGHGLGQRETGPRETGRRRIVDDATGLGPACPFPLPLARPPGAVVPAEPRWLDPTDGTASTATRPRPVSPAKLISWRQSREILARAARARPTNYPRPLSPEAHLALLTQNSSSAADGAIERRFRWLPIPTGLNCTSQPVLIARLHRVRDPVAGPTR